MRASFLQCVISKRNIHPNDPTIDVGYFFFS